MLDSRTLRRLAPAAALLALLTLLAPAALAAGNLPTAGGPAAWLDGLLGRLASWAAQVGCVMAPNGNPLCTRAAVPAAPGAKEGCLGDPNGNPLCVRAAVPTDPGAKAGCIMDPNGNPLCTAAATSPSHPSQPAGRLRSRR
jgi:hypothetical protein